MASEWANANKGGQPVDSFIEGPCFDAKGQLYVVDIPFGRIFRIDPLGVWTLKAEYDGWPNGLKVTGEGRIFIADYARGIMEFNPQTGEMTSLLATHNSEGFKGCNDLHFGRDGSLYFTDQGQTGLHDPTGRVYRFDAFGKIEALLTNGPSPNGLTLDPTGSVLYVAMTRDNSVWRAPLLRQGGVAKVGRFCQYFGVSGPDGLAMDRQGRLYVAHASLGCVFVHAPNGECIARILSPVGPTCTNLTLSADETRLFITESSSATILVANIDGL